MSSNLAGSARSSLFLLVLLAYLDTLPRGPNMGPNACIALGRRLVSVIPGTFHHCIMHRLSHLSPRMQTHGLIKLLQRLASAMVSQRVSPANAHYEMLASLDLL